MITGWPCMQAAAQKEEKKMGKGKETEKTGP